MIAAAVLAYSGTIKEVNGVKIHSHWIIAIAFIIGAFLSALAGYFGMRIATKANVDSVPLPDDTSTMDFSDIWSVVGGVIPE